MAIHKHIMRINSFKIALLLISYLINGCNQEWSDGPYKIYWINGERKLGYSLGNGAFISRLDAPKLISSNNQFISIYSCHDMKCHYFYIDKEKDHKFAEHNEFVYGPFDTKNYKILKDKLNLPTLNINK